MKTQIEGVDLKYVIARTSLAGWVLLARPVVFILFERRRDLDAYAAVDFSGLVFILYSIVAFYVGWITINGSNTKFGKNLIFSTPLIVFFIYSLLGIASMLWSVNPSLTGFRAFECIAMTILIVAVVQGIFESGSLRYVILWSLLYCAWSVLWSIIRTARWTTDLGALLVSSQMMSTSFFFMALYFVPRKWYNYLIIIMSVFSMSTVAYIGMAIGSISSFWNEGRARVVAITGAFVVVLALVAVGPYKLLKDTIFFDKTSISIEETSGRNHLLEATMDCLEKYPMGLGFFAAEPYVLYAKNLGAISAHNSFFSAGMGLGFPGVILMGIFLLSLGFMTFSHFIPKDYRSIMIGCFCVTFLHCMGNPSVGTRVIVAWIPCMYIFVLICGMYIYGKYYELEESTEEETDNIESI